ncbi:unnamed protein product [Lactuca saligna]|uniref:Uncharacterized protein n=1 Tax=Lactuca saligna TaxID=75948 RepID=A0AA35VQD0_LACSI|nr:unnamed protein product [Lactuca saligna]
MLHVLKPPLVPSSYRYSFYCSKCISNYLYVELFITFREVCRWLCFDADLRFSFVGFFFVFSLRLTCLAEGGTSSDEQHLGNSTNIETATQDVMLCQDVARWILMEITKVYPLYVVYDCLDDLSECFKSNKPYVRSSK